MDPAFFEVLESRCLFAGLTILATGRLGGLGGWMQAMTDTITARLGGPSQVGRYVLHLNPDADKHLIPDIEHVDGTATLATVEEMLTPEGRKPFADAPPMSTSRRPRKRCGT